MQVLGFLLLFVVSSPQVDNSEESQIPLLAKKVESFATVSSGGSFRIYFYFVDGEEIMIDERSKAEIFELEDWDSDPWPFVEFGGCTYTQTNPGEPSICRARYIHIFLGNKAWFCEHAGRLLSVCQ